MPLTPLQHRLLGIIAHNRTPEIHVAKGSVVNADDGRCSSDSDLICDRIEALTAAVGADTEALQAAGLAIHWQAGSETFHRAIVSDGADSTRLDWAIDSDFRFYPAQQDDRFGYAFHPVDLATDKFLATVGRNEVRDAIDLMTACARILPLGATAWAAAAKAPGWTPDGLVERLCARARFNDAHIAKELMTGPLDAAAINNWLRAACDAARDWLCTVPRGHEFGLFIDQNGQPAQPDFAMPGSASWRIHEGHCGGAWPSSAEISGAMIQDALK